MIGEYTVSIHPSIQPVLSYPSTDESCHPMVFMNPFIPLFFALLSGPCLSPCVFITFVKGGSFNSTGGNPRFFNPIEKLKCRGLHFRNVRRTRSWKSVMEVEAKKGTPSPPLSPSSPTNRLTNIDDLLEPDRPQYNRSPYMHSILWL